MKRILFVEDDLSLIHGLSYALKKQGYELHIARTYLEAKTLWSKINCDLIILDVSLPDGSGYDLCQDIRKTSKVPISVFSRLPTRRPRLPWGLTSEATTISQNLFKLAVLLSRINALLRRSENFSQPSIELNSNGIQVQMLKREVFKDGMKIQLTAGEYKLLCFFMENPNIVLSPEQILGRLWDCEENYIDNSSLTVYIRRLRAKIEDNPKTPSRIVTVRRMGYKWNILDGGEV